jgi:hypothetical protein
MLDSLHMSGISYFMSGLPYIQIKQGFVMSQQERVSWVSLIVTMGISVWYFAIVLGQPGDTPLFGLGMAVFGFILIVAAIVAAIASSLAMRWVQKRAGGDPQRRERLDERDRLINLRAARNAYVVLALAIGSVLALIATIQMFPMPAGSTLRNTVLLRMAIGPLTAPLLAQWLLLALTLADVSKYVTRIVSYRRGY